MRRCVLSLLSILCFLLIYSTTGYSQEKWTLIPTEKAPDARVFQTIVWTGSQMIIWGGWSNGQSNTGGIYDPSTNEWMSISAEKVPDMRENHTAVWTESSMIVWGGVNDNVGVLNTGGQYDPSTNTWRPITTEGVPEARNGHTAIWTGNQMIVWGGSDDEGVSNTGAKFSE